MTRIIAIGLSLVAGLAFGQTDRSPASILAEKIRGTKLQSPTRKSTGLQRAFAPMTRGYRKSVVRVLCESKRAALGLVVDKRGLVLTKHSELKGTITCRFHDGREVSATIVSSNHDLDLALLRVDVAGSAPLALATQTANNDIGSWVITTGLLDVPVGIGVISNAPRRVRGGVLGVALIASPKGPAVQRILITTEQGGLQTGDLIRQAKGLKVDAVQDVIASLSGSLPGERVELTVERNDRLVRLNTKLHRESALIPGGERVNLSMSGPLSRRRSGFDEVLVHDTILKPEDCGGPLLNSKGEIIGINIARANRTTSFALPVATVNAAVVSMTHSWLESSSRASVSLTPDSDSK